ncbi:26S proteasome regulatory subunit 6A-like [Rosa chinensis]|uniref:26S proteasome regulatory subunit 6A-like n=1 Tax=Rosa chinensis TaxID=74649 RepID=UPI001AD8D40C|nr:26S proteasome regulatory subunit 6A-like [Rosa chinensis]
MATNMVVEDMSFEDDQLAAMTTDDIVRATHLLDNEIRILKEELQRTNLELDSYKEKIKENQEKIKLNKQLPCLVGNIVEESPGNGLSVEKILEENSDFDRAVSLSLKTAEQEKAIREMQLNDKNQDPGVYSTRKQGRSSQQNGAEVVEQQLVSEESKRDGGSHLQQGKLVAHSDVLGSLSPKELDEAIMLETALFGKSPYT